METSKLHQHGIITQNTEKLQRTSHTKLDKKKNKIAHHKLTLTHDGSTPKTV
jgi:hypothetical protein